MRTLILILLGVLGPAAAGMEPSRMLRPPVLSVTPTTLTFNAPEGGPNPALQTITIQNTGNGLMTWSATWAAAWIDVQPPSGQLATGKSIVVSVLVDVVTPALTAGAYADTVTIDAGAVTGSPQPVTVNLTVSNTPVLSATPTTLDFTAPVGGPNPPSRTVTVSNVGGGTLNWTASSVGGAAWMGFSPSSGSLSAGASVDITVTIDVVGPGLVAGPYAETLTIDAGAVTGSPQPITVNLTVTGTPVLQVTPATLSFTAPVGGPNPSSQSVTITNAGGGTLSWMAATGGAAWLGFSPPWGNLGAGESEPLTLTVDVITPALVDGIYMETVTITAAGASGSPATVDVTLDVTSQPVISLNPTSLTFDAPVGGGNPAAQAVSITNSGLGTLNWTATDPEAWLSESPGSGSLTPIQSEPLTVSVNVAGLASGTYTATIQVTDGAASNSPQIISITLNVPLPIPPVTIEAGQCGSVGLEFLIPLFLISVSRRIRRRGRRS